jgi:hypothetical protein
MLELAKVNELITKAASAILKGPAGVTCVMSQPISDSHGQDALDVTIVLKTGSVDKITGDMVLDTLVSADRALRAAGDDRFPIIHYVTEEELAASADPEC